MKLFFNFIRYFLFLLISIPVILFLFYGFLWLLQRFVFLSFALHAKVGTVWFIVIFFLIGVGIIQFFYGWFKALCSLIVFNVSKISPSTKFSFYTILIISIIGTISNIYSIWVAPESQTILFVFISIVATIMAIGFGYLLGISPLFKLNYDGEEV